VSTAEAVERKPGPLGDDVLPILFDHCKAVYRAMFDRAEKRYADEPLNAGGPAEIAALGNDNQDAMLVYEGHLTRLFTELRLSVPYYSSVTKELKRMGCIRQLRRGGGNSPSQWELIQEPTEELYKIGTRNDPPKTIVGQMQQQLNSVNNRLLRVEQALGLVSSD